MATKKFHNNAAKFHNIFKKEIKAINARRALNNRQPIQLEKEGYEHYPDKTPIKRPSPDDNVIGLALSGGGIRSAAFSLGVLQALDAEGKINKIDYLSTVSGGGYIGTSMTAAMSKTASLNWEEEFPFKSKLLGDEARGIQHIRNYSNYLFPEDFMDIFINVAAYLRGLIANVVLLLLPVLLFLSALTIWFTPYILLVFVLPIVLWTGFSSCTSGQNHSSVGYRNKIFCRLLLMIFLISFIGPQPFLLDGISALTTWSTPYVLSLVLVLPIVLLTELHSCTNGQNYSSVGCRNKIRGKLLLMIFLISFIGLQPFLLDGMRNAPKDTDPFWTSMVTCLKNAAILLAPIGTVIGFFGRFLGDALKQASAQKSSRPRVARITIKLAMYAAGAAVLVALWVAYLHLSFWGILDYCTNHVPSWLYIIAHGGVDIPMLYTILGFVLLIPGVLLLEPNSNSLHQLYRDRLSKAFFFHPHLSETSSELQDGLQSGKAEQKSDLQPPNELKLSELSSRFAPYHLINTALNIEASKEANRRGRNADFFVFSKLYIGSKATGYVRTKKMEEAVKDLNAGTAMAISGAAASSNMGAATIKPLVPALAILNIRLGYWLPNPSCIANSSKRFLKNLQLSINFFRELLGILDEKTNMIYLTDGGHIENLGIYELLRRRCKLIIAVDAEADPEMSFQSLITLERYARIDFGILIDLPWQKIRDATQKASKQIMQSGNTPSDKSTRGPHCALGKIYYPSQKNNPDEKPGGLLLYIKSSITGDENDYIMDYKRRNSAFPHETTLDQLFSEEQFEVYRALGFHAALHALDKRDQIAINDPVPLRAGEATMKDELFKILA